MRVTGCDRTTAMASTRGSLRGRRRRQFQTVDPALVILGEAPARPARPGGICRPRPMRLELPPPDSLKYLLH